MSEHRSLKITANRIARKLETGYIPGPGPDIKCPTCTIAVESLETLPDASRKLSGYRVPVGSITRFSTKIYEINRK